MNVIDIQFYANASVCGFADVIWSYSPVCALLSSKFSLQQVNPDEVKVFSIAFGVKQPREIVFQRYPDRQSPSPPPGFVSPSKAKPPPPSSSDSDDETKEGMKKVTSLVI